MTSIRTIAIIAAGGRTGAAVVTAALEKGYSVRAGVHSKHSLTPHPRLTILHCDATNPQEVQTLLQGADAVVSCLGHTTGSNPDVQTQATRIILRRMHTAAIRRFVDVTGTGVRLPGDTVPWIDRILNALVAVIDPARMHDGQKHFDTLRQSDLDWTVKRVLKLQNTPPRSFALRLHGPAKLIVGRAELAQAMLQVLENQSYIRQAPMVGRP
jgi:hypothetical protein